LDPIANVTVAQSATAQTMTLTGISAGSQTQNPVIRISATSSNPRLVPTLTTRYTSPGRTASLTFMPMANALGVATITVTVSNGARSNNIVRRSFQVTVLPNHPPTLNPIANMTVVENAAAQTITLTGITSGSPTENQVLKVSATSNNSRLVPAPLIQYNSLANTALLTFKPAANRSGVAIIAVTVNDGSRNNNIIQRYFTVTVAAPANNTANSGSSSGYAASGNASLGTNAAATLSTIANANGRFSFQVTGVRGGKYVVQATSDLVHWTSVQTNTAPFIFQDASASSYRQRFYRANYLP
jgi:hypothetical protein